jgi:hypothetical protein
MIHFGQNHDIAIIGSAEPDGELRGGLVGTIIRQLQ